MQTVLLTDLAVHVKLSVGPSSSAPTLVFANSLGTDFRIWDDVVAALGHQFTVLRYDKRGHGLSDTGETPYGMETLVSDLANLMDHFEISNAVIVGLSVGGMIAQGLALSRPDLVRGLVLSNTAHKIGDQAGWNARIEAVMAGGIESILNGTMEKWFTPDFRRSDNPVFRLNRTMLQRSPRDGYVATCHALAQADYTQGVTQIRVPTLCIAGDQDGSTPAALVRSLADKIDGSEFHIVDDAGHIPCVQQPKAYAALIERFVSKTVSAKS